MKDIFKEKCVMKKYIDNENLIRHPMINQQQTDII